MGNVDSYDVIVIGAGASGLWSAIELAPDHEVLVLEAGRVGAGASGYAAGFVGPFADWAPYPDAIAHSIAAFRELDGRYGFTFHERPYVELAETELAGSSLRNIYRPLFERAGYDIEYCNAAELEDRWPDRFDLSGFDGGLVKSECGVIDARDYVTALCARAREAGAEIRTQTSVETVTVENGSIVGVETEDGRIGGDVVVCATGARTNSLVGQFTEIPVRRFIYSNIRIEAEEDLSDDYPMMYGQDVWWRPEPNRPETFLVSGGMYFLPNGKRPPRSPPSEYLQEVRSVFESIVRDVSDVRVVTGSYHTCSIGSSITPDALPVIDAPASAPDGLVVVSAVTAGISISPFTGAAVRSLVTGADAPITLDPFAADRFDSTSTDFRVHEIREMPSTFPTGNY